MNDSTAQPRHDLYAGIHKALRLQMCQTLSRIGSLSADDAADRAVAVQALRELVQTFSLHLNHEQHHVHPMLEAAQPGSAARVEQEHEEHRLDLARFTRIADSLEGAQESTSAADLHALYRSLALFVSANLVHMEHEEQTHNALLWSHYGDAELLALEGRIVADTEPAALTTVLRWMLPALTHAQRLHMLSGMRTGLPAAAFTSVLEIAHELLPQPAWGRLAAALNVPAQPGLACG